MKLFIVFLLALVVLSCSTEVDKRFLVGKYFVDVVKKHINHSVRITNTILPLLINYDYEEEKKVY